jgi:hypothetical protein
MPFARAADLAGCAAEPESGFSRHNRAPLPLSGGLRYRPITSQNFAWKVRISGKLKDTRQVALDFVLTPDPLHGRLGNSQLAGQRTASPSCSDPAVAAWLDRLFWCNSPVLRLPLRPERGPILQRPKPTSGYIAPLHLATWLKCIPTRSPIARTPNPWAANSTTQSSLCQPLWGALGAYQLLQLLFFSRTQH